MDEAYEGFGFLRRRRVDVAQESIKRERARPDEIGWIFDGLLWAIHLDYYSTASLARVRCQAG